MSNKCPEITVVVNDGKLNLYWAPTAIKQSLPSFCLFNNNNNNNKFIQYDHFVQVLPIKITIINS